jgi:hypothetical protein
MYPQWLIDEKAKAYAKCNFSIDLGNDYSVVIDDHSNSFFH